MQNEVGETNATLPILKSRGGVAAKQISILAICRGSSEAFRPAAELGLQQVILPISTRDPLLKLRDLQIEGSDLTICYICTLQINVKNIHIEPCNLRG